MAETSTPVEVFCCYCHTDETWLHKLEAHLSLLKRQGLISLWHDQLIVPATDRAKTIDTHLETASIILLFVSADFLASDYCYSIAMKRALERHEANEARVIPILVRPVDWKDAPFAHLQALPTNAKPITSWRSKESALVDVTSGLRRTIEDLPLLTASAPRAVLPAIWNIPYPRNPFFLGRDVELLHVRQNFQAGQTTAFSQPQAISGLGGIGKTQLALEYAYRYYQDYAAILWARAESTEALISSYVALATLLRLPEREATEQKVMVQAVKTWLQTHRAWLLILDNADDLALLPAFLPPALAGHLLLTTRATATGRLAHRLEIEILPPEQGALFLLRRAAFLALDENFSQTASLQQELAMQISEELGGLPLALDQAGAYLEETGCGLADYEQMYRQHRDELLRKRGGLVADHPKPVAATWSLSFQQAQAKNPATADLLYFCAFLAPDAIPEEILTAGAFAPGSVLAPVAVDPFQLNQALEALRSYSLIRRNSAEKTFSIHRLVQTVLQDSLEEEARHFWTKRVILALNSAFPHVMHVNWSQCERLLSHALLATRYIETEHFIKVEAGRLLVEVATYLRDRVRYPEAELLYQRALQIQEQIVGPEHLDVASSLLGLARLYYEQGKYREAEPLSQRALQIQEQIVGPEHPDVSALLNGLANIYKAQGKYTEAESLHQRALKIWEQSFGQEHPDVAIALNNLAATYKAQGKYTEAEPLYQRALRIREQSLGLEHPLLASTLTRLASLYKAQGKYTEAEPLHQRALKIWEQSFGQEHPDVAIALNNLANLYYEQGKYTEAEPLHQRALQIRERKLGATHPLLGDSLNNLAELYQAQGKHAEAESLYQRALKIGEQSFGQEHPNVAYPLSGLANLYYEQSRYGEAEHFYRRALRICEQPLGPEPFLTAEVMHHFARFLETQNNGEEAKFWYIRALAIREQTFGKQHAKTMETRQCLIALLHTMGLHEEATQLEANQPGP